MTVYTPEDLDMFDLTWFAVDRHDEIAVFWTAGKGKIAHLAIQTKESLDQALTILEGRLPMTEAVAEDRSIQFDLRGQAPADPVERQTARLGFYVYDHLDQHRQQVPPDPHLHVRLARPHRPITLNEVSAELATFLTPLNSEWLDFRSTEVMDVRDLELLVHPPAAPPTES